MCETCVEILVRQITTIVLTIEENGWKVDIPFEPCSTRTGSGPVARWLSSVDPPQFVIIKRSDYSSTLYVLLFSFYFVHLSIVEGLIIEHIN